MKRHPFPLVKPLLVVTALLAHMFHSPLASGETINCTAITTLPAFINVPGAYCLTGKLLANIPSGLALTIQASDVALDLNGFTIDNSAAGPATTAVGVYAFNRRNVTIRNGALRGFGTAIELTSSLPNTPTLEGLRIERITCEAGTFRGLHVEGSRGAVVRDNVITSTNGTASGLGGYAEGIRVSGSGTWITGNLIEKTTSLDLASAIAISLTSCNETVVEGNKINNEQVAFNSLGIEASNSSDVLIVNNRISSMSLGIDYVPGTTGKFRDNMTMNCATPFTGGTNAGNNF